ncbi:hypothetical protein C4546_00290 [Candidatus Parcubacteria bacterium]|jgi:hypothetical protein|nr:MAG: hypothetical protein C4546_00290 [Candidatus Parcubacteria bacterium]
MSKFTKFFKKHPFKPQPRDSENREALWRANNLPMVLGFLIVILAIGYLFQINRSSTKSFTVHALVKKQNALLEQRRALELQQAELSALTNLENSPVITGMVASTNAEYLLPPTADVARK